ncbi:MAG: hypothetical protein GOU97_00790 [Nanoarchaeota archaeon]|nr:hypothetical protein [Nanoarchaeota archaeon]
MFLSKKGSIGFADYYYTPKIVNEEDKKKWVYFKKKCGLYYACTDFNELGVKTRFFANWVWQQAYLGTEEKKLEEEKMLYDEPILTRYVRFGLNSPFLLEQFVVLDLGCGTNNRLTNVTGVVPAGRSFRAGMKGDVTKVNVLSKSSLDTKEFQLFEPRQDSLEYYLENRLEHKLNAINAWFSQRD